MTPLEAWLSTFPAYQMRWMYDRSRVAVCVKSRQIGLSHATAGGAVIGGLLERRTQIILSASQDLSDEVLGKVRSHCETLADLGKPAATDFALDNATEIAWKTGGRVIALPANPRTARSYSGDVWLDEAAYFQDEQGVRDAVFPIVSRGDFRLRICSTPNGTGGLFYEWASNPPPGWSLHRITVDDAQAQRFPVDRAKLWDLCGGDDRVFSQWYMCSFLDGNLQLIPTALVDRALRWEGAPFRLDDEERSPAIPVELYAGLDVGRHHDLTVLTVLAKCMDVVWVLAVLTCPRTAFKKQKALIREARRTFQWDRLFIDAGGMGEDMAEEFVEAWGEDEVVPLKFTHQVKADLATRALRWFRDERIRLPKDTEGVALREECVSVRRVITEANNVVYESPRTSKGHGDRFWSFALALKGCGEPVVTLGMGHQPAMWHP